MTNKYRIEVAVKKKKSKQELRFIHKTNLQNLTVKGLNNMTFAERQIKVQRINQNIDKNNDNIEKKDCQTKYT